jgi:type VI secretion system protein ImpK
LTGGSESGFGSGGGPPIPADPSEDEQAASDVHDAEVDDSTGGARDRGGSFASSVDDIEIPRHSVPFRKWSAAYGYRDSGPSLWARLRGWIAGLFRRKQLALRSASDERDEDLGLADDETGTLSDEYGTSAPKSRHSFDDLDAPSGEPHPAGEVASRRKSAELPHPDDFEPPWDDPSTGHESHEAEQPTKSQESDAAVDEPLLFASRPADQPTNPPIDSASTSRHEATAPDPLWDEPRVGASANAPAEAISRGDLDFVWTPPGPDDVDLLAESRSSAAPESGGVATPAPKRQSFISRLFSKKKKDEQAAIVSEFDAFVEEERAGAKDGEESVDDSVSAREPAVDDFAIGQTDVDANAHVEARTDEDAAAQAAGDFDVDVEVDVDVDVDVDADVGADVDADVGQEVEAATSPPKRPSLIARLFSRKSKDAPPVESEIDAAIADLDVIEEKLEPMVEASTSAAEPETDDRTSDVADEEPAIHAARRPSLAHSAEDAAQLADFLATPHAAGRSPGPGLEPKPKKPGFFSRLMWRKSQVKVPVVKLVEPDEPPVDEIAASTESVDESLPELSAAVEVEQEVVAGPDDADLARWAPPVAEDEVAEAAAPVDITEPEPEPEPLVPFIDARDDFGADFGGDFGGEPADVAAPSSESARITEAVAQPVVDPLAEGERTDEFEVVPGVPADMAETATLAQVAPGFFGRLLGRKKASTGETTADGAAPGAAADIEGKPPFVLAKFRMFYNEIIRDKHQKSDVISGFATAIVSAAAADMADPEFAAQLLSKRLSELLELQAAESNWTGGDAVKYYPDAQYAMVALADETFLTIDWPGRPSWRKYMLEPKMYGTRGADTEFFSRVDTLLRDPDPPRGARDLARVYLLVIASGFRGLFREPGLKRPLAEYRRRLYEFSHLTDPLELYGRDRKIFPEAASQTLAGRAVGRFTAAQKWLAAVVILLVMYATVSHFAWTKLSADLKDVMSRIESSTGQGGAAR